MKDDYDIQGFEGLGEALAERVPAATRRILEIAPEVAPLIADGRMVVKVASNGIIKGLVASLVSDKTGKVFIAVPLRPRGAGSI
jgi:hypothetical protein